MKKIILLTTMTVSLCCHLSIVQAETLLQVYQQASVYDAQLGSQEADYMAAIEAKPQALAGKRPQITWQGSATASRNHIYHDAPLFGGASVTDNIAVNYSLDISKSLYNPNLDKQIRQADAVVGQAFAGLDAQRQSLIMRVAQAYFDYLLAADSVEFSRSEHKSTQRRMLQAQAFFDAGRSPITDVREAQAAFDLVQAQQVSAQQALDVARESLRVLTGRLYNQLAAPNGQLSLSLPEPTSVSSWVKMGYLNNKLLINKLRAVDSARAALEVSRTENAPKLDLLARHSGNLLEGEVLLDQRDLNFSMGVQATVPLYTGGAVDSRIRQAKYALLSAEQDYEYQRRLTEQQVRSAYLAVNSAIALTQARKQAVVSAETAFDATSMGFEAGARTIVDVLGAQRNLFAARRDFNSAQYQYLLSILNLKLAAGILSEQDLALMSQALIVRRG